MYEISIEIAAMNRPLGDDELLKAVVANEIAWKTDKAYFVKPFLFLRGFSEVIEEFSCLSRAEYARGGLSSRIRLDFKDDDANNLLQIFRDGAFKAAEGEGLDLDAAKYDYNYGDGFCRLFKCAVKTAVADLDDNGRWICHYYSPDGKRDKKAEGGKGEPSQSMDDFMAEWYKTADD